MPKKKTTRRDQMLAKAREYTRGTYVSKFVAPEFQRLIRAEAGALPGELALAVVNGKMNYVRRSRGQCLCVTCGKVGPWSGGGRTRLGGMHTGHFLGRCNSLIFQEEGVAPQCSSCNVYHGGMPEQFRLWMEHVRGVEVIERLEALKGTIRRFTRDELVDMRIAYKLRMKEAERKLLGG